MRAGDIRSRRSYGERIAKGSGPLDTRVFQAFEEMMVIFESVS